MSWFNKISQETHFNIPKILYHATYRAFNNSILEKGLIPRYTCIWDDCQYGVYLANNPNLAESFCETSENVPDEYIDDIIIFSVDTSLLDSDKFEPDPHTLLDKNQNLECYIYRGVIPVNTLKIL